MSRQYASVGTNPAYCGWYHVLPHCWYATPLTTVVAQLGGPPSLQDAAPDRLAGYFVIEAPSPQRATEVARTCPHLKYGGRVVVMTIAS